MLIEDSAMSYIEIDHTRHIKPANLETVIKEVLALAEKVTKADPEAGDGWCLVNAAMALRQYHSILEQAYLQSLREGFAGTPTLVKQTHDEAIFEIKREEK
jgi:hypothetical protein